MSQRPELVSEIYPDSKGFTINEVKIPEDIKDYIDKIENVRRFSHTAKQYPEMIVDNSKMHTIRCAFRAASLYPTQKDLIRTLWIHDIPEHVADTDTSAVERYNNPEIARKSENKEKTVAKTVLSKSDYVLFEDFVLAEDFLRRMGSNIPKNQQALVANVIDYIDGNLVGSYYLTKWLKNHEYDGKIPSGKALEYILDIRENTIKAIEKPKVNKEIRDNIHYLIGRQLQVAVSLWSFVEEDRIPETMRTELLKMKSLACC